MTTARELWGGSQVCDLIAQKPVGDHMVRTRDFLPRTHPIKLMAKPTCNNGNCGYQYEQRLQAKSKSEWQLHAGKF